MAKTDKPLETQRQQTFDKLMSFLDFQFKSFPDHRVGNAVRYELADALKGAFAMFSVKSPSLPDFKKQTSPTSGLMNSIFTSWRRRKLLRTLVNDVKQHLEKNGPWKYKVPSIYYEPEVEVALNQLSLNSCSQGSARPARRPN